MVMLRRLKSDASVEEIANTLNMIVDALLGVQGGRIALLDDDGELQDIRGGTSLGTNEPALKVRSACGEHVLVQHSNGIDTLLEIQDSGVTIGPGQRIDGDLEVTGELQVNGNVILGDAITDATVVSGTLTISKAATMNDTLHVQGAVDFDDTLNVDGQTNLEDTVIDGALDVTGSATFEDPVVMQEHLTVGNASGVGSGIIRLPNDEYIFSEEVGGTDRALIGMDSSDVLRVGRHTAGGPANASLGATGNVYLLAGANIVIQVTSGNAIGFFAQTPQTRQSIGSGATDLATVITLANNIRSALNNYGLTQT